MGALEPGRLIADRYRLEARLGSGVSADVWRGHDERLGRPVALKLLHAHLLPDEASRRRFEAEARAAAGLSHPGIVPVHDVLALADGPAIVFEYVPGETLADLLARRGAVPPREAARISVQVAEALSHAHDRGVVHRDVKPANILLGTDGRARLVDFGIARSLLEAQARLTQAGNVVGTLRYMAPEQLAGESAGPPADLFALGAVLYEMLVGRPPFDADTPLALIRQHEVGPPPIFDAAAGLATVAYATLRSDPERRPSSASEVAAYLRGWLAGSMVATDAIHVPTPDAPTVSTRVAPANSGGRGGRLWPPAPAQVGVLLGVLALIALFLITPAALVRLAGGAPGSPDRTSSDISPPAPSPDRSPSPSATASPSPSPSLPPSPSPSPTSIPDPTPAVPGGLAILEPADGTVVRRDVLRVRGVAPPNARIVRDIPFAFDESTTSDDRGRWSMEVSLVEGENTLTFRVGDDSTTEETIRVSYVVEL